MTERTQNADFRRKPQIFADSPLLLEIPTFGGRSKLRFSRNLSETSPETPQDLLGFLPNSFKDVTRAEPTQSETFSLMPGRREAADWAPSP